MDVLHPGPTPAVDRLVIIAHGGDMGAAARKNPEPGVLDGVGVLELVHQKLGEAALVVGQERGVLEPKLMAAQKELGEIHKPPLKAEGFVGFVNL